MRYDDPSGDYGRQTRQRAVLTAILKKSSSVKTLLNQDFISSITDQTQTDLTFDDLTALAKNYNSVRKSTSETHLQGTSAEVADQSMEVMKKSELQRVTNYIRKNLDLSKKKTGNIEYNPSTQSSSTSMTDQDINNIGTSGYTSNGSGYNSGY